MSMYVSFIKQANNRYDFIDCIENKQIVELTSYQVVCLSVYGLMVLAYMLVILIDV
jgi:hypothetical protein